MCSDISKYPRGIFTLRRKRFRECTFSRSRKNSVSSFFRMLSPTLCQSMRETFSRDAPSPRKRDEVPNSRSCLSGIRETRGGEGTYRALIATSSFAKNALESSKFDYRSRLDFAGWTNVTNVHAVRWPYDATAIK